jgi:hypothetical protein
VKILDVLFFLFVVLENIFCDPAGLGVRSGFPGFFDRFLSPGGFIEFLNIPFRIPRISFYSYKRKWTGFCTRYLKLRGNILDQKIDKKKPEKSNRIPKLAGTMSLVTLGSSTLLQVTDS